MAEECKFFALFLVLHWMTSVADHNEAQLSIKITDKDFQAAQLSSIFKALIPKFVDTAGTPRPNYNSDQI